MFGLGTSFPGFPQFWMWLYKNHNKNITNIILGAGPVYNFISMQNFYKSHLQICNKPAKGIICKISPPTAEVFAPSGDIFSQDVLHIQPCELNCEIDIGYN